MPHPGVIFDAAEQLDRIVDLGRNIRAKCPTPMREAEVGAALFVNLHTRDLLDEALFDPSTELAKWASRVVLEITERAAIDDVKDIAERIARLRQMGFRIAIDDIGAGYSGLNSFATIHPDLVKLDITLVRNIDSDPMRRRLVSMLVDLCGDMNIAVVAEGVETTQERDALVELGLDLFQGYLFARPAAPFAVPTF
jgi:EAL domain-containing protein (putative c-di-GMP-specific phosphodiesterase class I)